MAAVVMLELKLPKSQDNTKLATSIYPDPFAQISVRAVVKLETETPKA